MTQWFELDAGRCRHRLFVDWSREDLASDRAPGFTSPPHRGTLPRMRIAVKIATGSTHATNGRRP